MKKHIRKIVTFLVVILAVVVLWPTTVRGTINLQEGFSTVGKTLLTIRVSVFPPVSVAEVDITAFLEGDDPQKPWRVIFHEWPGFNGEIVYNWPVPKVHGKVTISINSIGWIPYNNKYGIVQTSGFIT